MRVSKELKPKTVQNRIKRIKRHLNHKIRGIKIHENNKQAKDYLIHLEKL